MRELLSLKSDVAGRRCRLNLPWHDDALVRLRQTNGHASWQCEHGYSENMGLAMVGLVNPVGHRQERREDLSGGILFVCFLQRNNHFS